MNLREQINIDAINVFLNLNEFAEEITLDGVATRAIVDVLTDADARHIFGTDSSVGDVWGVRGEHMELTLPLDAVPLPYVNQQMFFNGQPWIVSHVTPQKGLLNLKLMRHSA